MQRERRRDPYPWTWEIPLGVAVLVLVVLASAVQVGRGLANLLVGAGWTWPRAAEAAHRSRPGPGQFGSPVDSTFWTSLPGVVHGDAAAGLNPPPVRAAGAPLLWASLAITEVVAVAALAVAAVVVLRRWGPGRMKGMASPAEAEALLGVTRLRRVRGIVRPDLYDDRLRGQRAESGPSGPPGGTSTAPRRPASAKAWRLRVARRLLGSGTSRLAGHAVDVRERAANFTGADRGRHPSPWLLDSRATSGRPRTSRSDAPNASRPRDGAGEWG